MPINASLSKRPSHFSICPAVPVIERPHPVDLGRRVCVCMLHHRLLSTRLAVGYRWSRCIRKANSCFLKCRYRAAIFESGYSSRCTKESRGALWKRSRREHERDGPRTARLVRARMLLRTICIGPICIRRETKKAGRKNSPITLEYQVNNRLRLVGFLLPVFCIPRAM